MNQTSFSSRVAFLRYPEDLSLTELNIKLYSEFNSSENKTRSSIIILDTTRKPVRGITRQSHCWPGTDPTPLTNQLEKYSAQPNQLSYVQKTHLKTLPQTRLSILILSKSYPTSGM
jgi:hypothetical protein